MKRDLRKDAFKIIETCIKEMQPGDAVRRALKGHAFTGRLFLLAVGKAAWPMADAAYETLGDRVERGIVITKYGHSQGQICESEDPVRSNTSSIIKIYEAGHPVPDENSYKATEAALEMAGELSEDDTLLLLLSGGGSALFEKPLIPPAEIQDINSQLLASGADISEINTIRKRLSAVKGGRLAEAQYGLRLSDEAKACLGKETPKCLSNVESEIVGSVRLLCESAAKAAKELGYKTEIVADDMDCEARDAGKMLARHAIEWAGLHKDANSQVASEGSTKGNEPCALIYGGETVVHIKGTGKGGRNQELALSAAKGIDGLDNVLIFSFGSDGTDGPTDAAGGIVDGSTAGKLRELGISIDAVLNDNDSYNALKAVDSLIMTGPTGTNVNDVSVILVQP